MNKIGIAGAVSLIIAMAIYYNNDYIVYHKTDCVVLDKLTTTVGSKYSGKFYLVLRSGKGIVFDEIVSPTTFSQCDVGEKVQFNLRQMDIKQTFYENMVYFISQIVFAVLGVCLSGAYVVEFYIRKKRNEQ